MSNISQPLIQTMDKILKITVNANDQDLDQLRRIFVPARTKALDDINDCLADFRQKRQYGMTFFFLNLKHHIKNICCIFKIVMKN